MELEPREQFDLGPYCLQYRQAKYIKQMTKVVPGRSIYK